MNSEISIKEIGHTEVVEFEKELKSFLHMNLSENYPEYDVDELTCEFYEKMLRYSEDGSAVLLGAFDDDKMIGFHWGHEVVFLGKKRMHSYMNGINPKYRGNHIGSNFFRKLENIARERGIAEVEAFCRKANPVAVNYHLHNGFEIESYRVVKKLD